MSEVAVATAPAWGRAVEKTTVHGHPCLAYAERPAAVADFLLTARRWAERELLVQGDRRLTFREHEEAVARVACELAERGVGPGSRVGLLAFNSVEWMVSFWAVHALGAVAVLGNAWWADTEAQEVLADAEPDLVITDRRLGFPTLEVATVRRAVEDVQRRVELPQWPRDEEALSIIMFSSGTTGKPKGVVMTARSVIANIQNILVLTGRLPQEIPAQKPGGVSMLTVPLFHLAGVQVCLTTLLSGGRLVFLDGKFDPAEVLRLIEAEKVRSWGCIPTMVSRVLEHPDFEAFDTSSVSSIPMGGAPASADLRRQISERFPRVRSGGSSMYGLTEAGGVVAAGAGKDIAGRPGCVGRALPVVELRIANPQADGAGEIQVRTPTITEGYLGDETPLTDAEGWVSSGDLGRIDAEGWLCITGRLKDIIIRGGENISSAHVEDVLHDHPDVAEVAVVALPHADLGEEVGAAVVLRPGAELAPASLLAAVQGRLARFEHPSRWWLYEGELPTNASGKIVRREVQRQWLEAGGTTIWPAPATG
ncbi:class I adenylate-forming enzyme family protein [Kocuria dechangensis]|nr:class I adenylate-forming enzyme family protein [Kocuria dechangensis]